MNSFYVFEAFVKKKKFTHAECIALTCSHVYLNEQLKDTK